MRHIQLQTNIWHILETDILKSAEQETRLRDKRYIYYLISICTHLFGKRTDETINTRLSRSLEHTGLSVYPTGVSTTACFLATLLHLPYTSAVFCMRCLRYYYVYNVSVRTFFEQRQSLVVVISRCTQTWRRVRRMYLKILTTSRAECVKSPSDAYSYRTNSGGHIVAYLTSGLKFRQFVC